MLKLPINENWWCSVWNRVGHLVLYITSYSWQSLSQYERLWVYWNQPVCPSVFVVTFSDSSSFEPVPNDLIFATQRKHCRKWGKNSYHTSFLNITSQQKVNPLQQSLFLMTLRRTAFENIVGEEEGSGNQHFLLPKRLTLLKAGLSSLCIFGWVRAIL